ncbi:hypothetical protein [Actinomadura alba]|uniref:Uncharacterized protein n=1 Tax=Actinomadura alba TaxID=406431 RepID=A0ABR7LIG1_9ACTN|nr:hypothetical protein [Actinomadura alba]MBC6464292.1 hypothetical protein [Actinomadura alba]
MTDIDDFTDYTEGCACGHPRRQHGNEGCDGTNQRLDHEQLPAPSYADESDPFAWPVNWPPPEQAPTTEIPCTCDAFGPAEPEPPEDW